MVEEMERDFAQELTRREGVLGTELRFAFKGWWRRGLVQGWWERSGTWVDFGRRGVQGIKDVGENILEEGGVVRGKGGVTRRIMDVNMELMVSDLS